MSLPAAYLGLSIAWLACVSTPDSELVSEPAGRTRAEPSALSVETTPAANGCAVAEVLRASPSSQRASFSRRGSTRGSQATSQSTLGSCRDQDSGPAVWYRLDLQALARAVEFRAVLSADFDAVLDLRQGACEDTLSLDCDRGSALGKPGSVLSRRLDPGVYWLVVGGASPASEGEFALELELAVELGVCESPPPNRSCETALQLPAQSVQTLLLDLSCAPLVQGERETLYYELDLSQEPAPVLASASIWPVQPEQVFARLHWVQAEPASLLCGTELSSSYLDAGHAFPVAAEASALLAPGHYFLAAEIESSELADPRVQLSLRLDEETCRQGAVANSCASAIDLDPNADVQLFEGSTLCNADQLSSGCSEGAPDQFYRLDLRGAAGATRVRAAILADGTDFTPVLFLVSAGEGAGCGEVSYCPDTLAQAEGLPLFDLTLRPDLYFVGVDGLELGNAGHYRLLVELAATDTSPCVNAAVAACAFADAALDCCYDSGAGCDRVLDLCGLEPTARACVCASNPACCGPDWRDADCAESYRACQYLCPEFSLSVGRCY